MKNSRINDTTSWRQWAEDFQKSKDDGFRELFKDKIRGYFLTSIKKQVFNTMGMEIFQYYDFGWSNENILTGKDDLPEYDVCRFIVGIHQAHSIFLSLDEIRELHYFEISIMLYHAIRNTFVMLCHKHNEKNVINGVDVVAITDRDIVELLYQYEKRSTEKLNFSKVGFKSRRRISWMQAQY